MDINSLAHTKWNCKYHIVFAPKYRRKIIYGQLKRDIANILSMLCKLSKQKYAGSHTYVSRDSTKHKCVKFRRVFKRKKYANDI